MLYNDLRSWMSKVEEFGELKTVEGIDWKYRDGCGDRSLRAQSALFGDSLR